MHSEALLDVRDLHAGYGETEVLRGVDLTIAPGEIVAVLGSNGVGKSTLNRALSGIVRARAGAIKFEGHDVVHEKPQAIVARGDAPRSTCCSTISDGERWSQSVSAL